MLLSTATFVTAEDEKPYKGQPLLIWNVFANNPEKTFDVWGQPANPFAVAYVAIVAWCKANEYTVTLVGNTEETKPFIAERQAQINELAAASLALTEYDAGPLFDQGYDCHQLPTATFIAQADPVLQAQPDAYYIQFE